MTESSQKSIFPYLVVATGIICCCHGYWFGHFIAMGPEGWRTGCFVFGIFYASGIVLLPLVTRTIFGMREYSSIYSRVAMVGSLCGVFAVSFWGFMTDSLGFGIVISIAAIIVLLIVLGLVSLSAAKKFESEM